MSESFRTCSSNEQTSAETREPEPTIAPAPLEPEDFYYENGLMVFTAAYHLKRGYCCNSGCRHCPFR
jgi:hypothetical protein